MIRICVLVSSEHGLTIFPNDSNSIPRIEVKMAGIQLVWTDTCVTEMYRPNMYSVEAIVNINWQPFVNDDRKIPQN